MRCANLLIDAHIPLLGIDRCMVRIVHSHNLAAILDVVLSAKQDVCFLKPHVLRLWNKEPDEQSEEYVYTTEEVEGKKIVVCKEGRKELLDDGIGDVLCL